MPFKRLWVLAMLAIFALQGCENAESSTTKTAERVGDDVAFRGLIVVLPVSEQSYLSEDFEFLYPMVDHDIRHWLQGQHRRVVPAEQVQAALDANGGALRQGLRSAKSQDVTSAMAGIISALSAREPVEAVFLPQLLINSMTLSPPHHQTSWNGVTREFILHGDRNVDQPLQVNAATLVVGIYNRFGQPEYFGRGGLDFLENGTRVGTGIVTSPKQPGQVSDASVQEAVRQALDPWRTQMESKQSAHAASNEFPRP